MRHTMLTLKKAIKVSWNQFCDHCKNEPEYNICVECCMDIYSHLLQLQELKIHQTKKGKKNAIKK